jgi:protein-tyrosine-phosphatase
VNQATVIFAMTEAHARTASMISPAAVPKVETLDTEGDIEDPIGGDPALYKNLAAKIKSIIERRLADRSLLGMEK